MGAAASLASAGIRFVVCCGPEQANTSTLHKHTANNLEIDATVDLNIFIVG
jgi:hypothetical protein